MWTALALLYMTVMAVVWFYPDRAEPGELPTPTWNPVVDGIAGALAFFGFGAYLLSWTPDLLRTSWKVVFFGIVAGHLAASGNDMYRMVRGTEVGVEPVGVDEQGNLLEQPIVERQPAWLLVAVTLTMIVFEAPLFVLNWRLAFGH